MASSVLFRSSNVALNSHRTDAAPFKAARLRAEAAVRGRSPKQIRFHGIAGACSRLAIGTVVTGALLRAFHITFLTSNSNYSQATVEYSFGIGRSYCNFDSKILKQTG